MIDEPTFSRPINRTGWWIHLVLIGGYFAATIPLALSQSALRHAFLGGTRVLIITSVTRIVLFFVVFVLACFASGASRDDLLLRWRPSWWVVPLGLAYSIALRIAIGLVLFAFAVFLIAAGMVSRDSLALFFSQNGPPVEKIVSLSAMRNDPVYFWLTITLISFIVAGLREELWRAGTLAAMRALWPNTFSNRTGELIAVGLIAIVFGLAHSPLGLLEVGITAILGFLLGTIMVMHRSVWPAVIAHGAFDAMSFAMIPWAENLRHLH